MSNSKSIQVWDVATGECKLVPMPKTLLDSIAEMAGNRLLTENFKTVIISKTADGYVAAIQTEKG